MRVRYEKFIGGQGIILAECDLTEKQARKRFNELKEDGKCGWVELVAEEDSEGGYMEILETHENIRSAMLISTLI